MRVTVEVPKKHIDEALKNRIQDLECENKRLTQYIKDIAELAEQLNLSVGYANQKPEGNNDAKA